MLHYLIYLSTATRSFRSDELHELLTVARRHNQEANITGMLLYRGGQFMQMLEGDREAIEWLMDRIERDPRHSDVYIFQFGPASVRNFPGWSMGFCDMGNRKDLPPLDVYVQEALEKVDFRGSSKWAKNLLLSFADMQHNLAS